MNQERILQCCYLRLMRILHYILVLHLIMSIVIVSFVMLNLWPSHKDIVLYSCVTSCSINWQFLKVTTRFRGLFVHNCRWVEHKFERGITGLKSLFKALKLCIEWHLYRIYSMIMTKKPRNLVVIFRNCQLVRDLRDITPLIYSEATEQMSILKNKEHVISIINGIIHEQQMEIPMDIVKEIRRKFIDYYWASKPFDCNHAQFRLL